jgi:hypothetical protein
MSFAQNSSPALSPFDSQKSMRKVDNTHQEMGRDILRDSQMSEQGETGALWSRCPLHFLSVKLSIDHSMCRSLYHLGGPSLNMNR